MEGKAAISPRPSASASLLDRRCTYVAAIFAAVVLGAYDGAAAATSGFVHQTAAKGLSVTVDTTWFDGFGYRPVQVTVTPTVPFTADQTVTIEFLARGYWGRDYDLRVAQDVELPAGSGPVHATLSVPQHLAWANYSINVLVDDELEEKLSTPWTGFANMRPQVDGACPLILVVGDTMPETAKLAVPFPLEEYYQYRSVPQSTVGTLELPTVAAWPPDKLPERWIDYSSLDVVCLSLGQLGELKQQRPAAFRAILDWTAAGGNLWVYGVGDDWQRLGQLEDLVALLPEADDTTDPLQRGWKEPSPSRYGRPALGATFQNQRVLQQVYQQNYGVATATVANVPTEEIDAEPIGSPDQPPERPHFLLRELDLGLIVAFASDNPFPGTAAEWNWVIGAMGPDRWLWTQRHGVSMTQPNRDYWNCLVPGVGLAPVTEFCLLISVFVLAIGPLNYWLLRRFKRLYLLVVTIPLGAAVVTFALFAYAILADGLGIRVRARSVTLLDQRRGQATCWARISYYAGLAPRRGLTFPDDVVVLPLEDIPRNDYRNRPPRRELIWEDDQWLASGWLSSRTRTQYVTVRSRPSSLGLHLAASQTDPKTLRATNALGTRIGQLLVCHTDGNYYWAADVAPSATATLEPIEPAEVHKRLREAYSRHPLTLPEGMEDRRYGGIFGVSRRQSYRSYGYGWRGGNSGIGDPTQRTSRMEMALSALARPQSTQFPLLQPGTYVAVVENSPEVDLGVPSARQEASFHVILGRW